MTPQDSFLYAAPVQPGHEDALRTLLLSMNRAPGVVDPTNPLLPFASFSRLHFARVLIISDLAAADRAVYQLPTSGLPSYLAFLGEIDGDEAAFRAELLRRAEPGLRQLFSHCIGFSELAFAPWFAKLNLKPSATYVNWVGRTVQQEHEEDALRRSLETYISANDAFLRTLSPQKLHAELRDHVTQQQRAGKLTLTPPPETPWRWQLRNALNAIGVPLLFLLLSPLLLLCAFIYLIQLRHWERTDPTVAPPLCPAHAAQLEDLENHDVTNQFNVFGSLKPGKARLWSMHFFLWIVNYTARHIYTRGGLGRVFTIHFARWVFFDGGQRMLFSSLYDGSLESYMDDFINKVGFGLNITFSNGIGYPRTRWLILDGCRDEQVFKRVLRRHQLPTEVWYNATPGLTAANKHRNSLIRAGVQSESLSDRHIQAFTSLL